MLAIELGHPRALPQSQARARRGPCRGTTRHPPLCTQWPGGKGRGLPAPNRGEDSLCGGQGSKVTARPGSSQKLKAEWWVLATGSLSRSGPLRSLGRDFRPPPPTPPIAWTGGLGIPAQASSKAGSPIPPGAGLRTPPAGERSLTLSSDWGSARGASLRVSCVPAPRIRGFRQQPPCSPVSAVGAGCPSAEAAAELRSRGEAAERPQGHPCRRTTVTAPRKQCPCGCCAGGGGRAAPRAGRLGPRRWIG